MPLTSPRSWMCGSQLTHTAAVGMVRSAPRCPAGWRSRCVRDHDAFAAGRRSRRVLQIRDGAPGRSPALARRARARAGVSSVVNETSASSPRDPCRSIRVIDIAVVIRIRALTSSTMLRNCATEAFSRGTGNGTAMTPAYKQPKNAERTRFPADTAGSRIHRRRRAPAAARRSRAPARSSCANVSSPLTSSPSPRYRHAVASGCSLRAIPQHVHQVRRRERLSAS